MTSTERRRRAARRLLMLAAACLATLGGGRAEAQWGWGMGWGMGWGGGAIANQQTLQYLNSRSLAAANAAYAERRISPAARNNVYAGNPNAYINNIRDNGDSFFQRFDIASRRSLNSQVVAAGPAPRVASAPPRPAPAPTPTIPPLANFFSDAGGLIWPSESPTEGDLESRRDAASTAASTVFIQARSQGFAPVADVTDARARLVDYGTPALDFLHRKASPGVATAFHSFLLSLYDALGTAATSRPSSR